MRATDLKPTRKAHDRDGLPLHECTVEIPTYLSRYAAERDAWLERRKDNESHSSAGTV